MTDRSSRFANRIRSVLALSALIVCSLGAAAVARADDPLGLYVGAAYGQAHIRVQPGEAIPGSTSPLAGLDMTHTAFKAIVGIRPLSFIGAEVSYMDFGQVSALNGQAVAIGSATLAAVSSERASQRGESAFALLYLPVPVIDVYAKAGLARMTTHYNVTYTGFIPGVGTCQIGQPNCGVVGTATASRDTTDTAFAYGAGLQWKLGSWAIRGEYERFDAAGANPSLLSIGMTYWLQ